MYYENYNLSTEDKCYWFYAFCELLLQEILFLLSGISKMANTHLFYLDTHKEIGTYQVRSLTSGLVGSKYVTTKHTLLTKNIKLQYCGCNNTQITRI